MPKKKKITMPKNNFPSNQSNMIIYNTADGSTSVSLYAKDGMVWMTQNQLAELFDTSKQNISLHINSILKNKELDVDSVVKEYLTTATDGKDFLVPTLRENEETYRSKGLELTDGVQSSAVSINNHQYKNQLF